MDIRILATLPRITMDTDALQLKDARIIKLPYDELLVLEQRTGNLSYDDARNKYTKYPPLFFEKQTTLTEKIADEQNPVYQFYEHCVPQVRLFHHALCVYTGMPLLSPTISAIHFDVRKESNYEQYPFIKTKLESGWISCAHGNSGKEYMMVNERPEICFTTGEAAMIGRFYEFILSRPTAAIAQLTTQWNALNALSLPGINQATRLMLLIGALEALLIRGIKTEINAHFKRRLFQLCGSDEDKDWMNQVYNLRSELVHGREPSEKIFRKFPFSAEELITRLTRMLVHSMCAMLCFVSEETDLMPRMESFRSVLDSEPGDPLLANILAESDYQTKHQLIHRWKQ